MGGSLQAHFNAVGLGLGYLCPFRQWTWGQRSLGRGWFSKDWDQDHSLKVNEQRCLKANPMLITETMNSVTIGPEEIY